jgi:hypothetical protein
MNNKAQIFITISIVSFYLTYISKKKLYAIGGAVLLIIVLVFFPGSDFYSPIFKEYVPFVSSKILLWLMYISSILAFFSFFIYSIKLEHEYAQNTFTNDLDLALKINIKNIIFWVILVFINIALYKMI